MNEFEKAMALEENTNELSAMVLNDLPWETIAAGVERLTVLKPLLRSQLHTPAECIKHADITSDNLVVILALALIGASKVSAEKSLSDWDKIHEK